MQNRITTQISVALWALTAVGSLRATELTFDIFTDAGKTSRLANGQPIPQSYGDNVNDFTPSGISVDGYYYDYGTNGGFTPGVTIEYQYLRPTPLARGNGGAIWGAGYGDLSNVVWDNVSPFFEEIRFVPAADERVVFHSFDAAGFGAQSGQTIKLVEDFGLPDETTLWSAGPDGTVAVTGSGHDHYAPEVVAGDGKVLSLIYGTSVNMAVDNIVFSEIPEPSALALLAVGGGWLLQRKIVHR